MNKAGVKEGIRKDSISHGLRSSIMALGGYPEYFKILWQKHPGKHADMVSKYIPSEIEHINAPAHNVLVINMPESRQVLDIPCEVRAIDAEPPTVNAKTDAPERPVMDDQQSSHAMVCPDNDNKAG